MAIIDESDLKHRLQEAGQDHLWKHLETLHASQRQSFQQQLAGVNWQMVSSLLRDDLGIEADNEKKRISEAQRAQPPDQLVRQPKSDEDRRRWDEARERGLELLRAGKVAAVMVAGGQGTRLGFDHPKGMFPIGPVSGHSLFQIFCEQILACSRQAECDIPYLIMTSDATHQATVEFFEQHQRFGLATDQLHFFQQGNMPAFDAVTHHAILSGPGQLALSPDGHGGMLRALAVSGLMDELQSRGIETLFYHQVDNPTTQVCDPAFLGWHVLWQADVSTKVVAKRFAEEKMGVAVSMDGVSKIIEYSDLPAEIAAKTDARGRILLWAGNTAIHVFQFEFLKKFATGGEAFPFHVARKAVTYWNESGKIVVPEQPNALKFEQFIFDILPLAKTSLIVETSRAAEFNPVKNKDGHDSPETCRAGMQALHRSWLRAAGAVIGDDVPIEISPLFALNAEDVGHRLSASDKFDAPTFVTID